MSLKPKYVSIARILMNYKELGLGLAVLLGACSSLLPPRGVKQRRWDHKQPPHPLSAKWQGRPCCTEFHWVLYLVVVLSWGKTDKRRKTEDRRKIQGLLGTCRVLFITHVNTYIYLQTVRERSAGRCQQGSRVQHSIQHTVGCSRTCRYFSNANFWYSKLTISHFVHRCLFLSVVTLHFGQLRISCHFGFFFLFFYFYYFF